MTHVPPEDRVTLVEQGTELVKSFSEAKVAGVMFCSVAEDGDRLNAHAVVGASAMQIMAMISAVVDGLAKDKWASAGLRAGCLLIREIASELLQNNYEEADFPEPEGHA